MEGPSEHGNEPYGFIKCWELSRSTTGSVLRRAHLHGVC
jgi:hypothetical protein